MQRLLTLLFHDVYADADSESGFPGRAAARYKLKRPDFHRQLDGLARVLETRPLLIREAGSAMPEAGLPLALTVDDGGRSFRTQVADEFERRGWWGHCFVTTGCIGRRGFLTAGELRELHARGHVIGSHSVSHPARFAACPWDEMLKEWCDSRRALEDILGAPVRAASVPGGYFTARVARAAEAAGITALFTSEPRLRVGYEDGCMVLGRYTVRRGAPPDFAARLLAGRDGLRLREWAAWNSKGILKTLLGSAYPRLTRVGRSGLSEATHV